ncbi:MAG TPA: sulfatase-like hydrolase/transferase, partial [Acidobacteriota bacterium]|nr:sulfatase-like hydrolase/transferase [Acidobacteriota bacterium]
MKTRTHVSRPPTTATAAIVIAFFVATLFLFGPAMVYLTNAIEFSNSLGDLAVAGAIVAAVAFLLLAAVLVGLRALGAAFLEKGLALIFALGVLLWFQGNFLHWNYGPLDGRAIPWSAMARFGYIDGLIWLGVLAAAVLLSPLVLRITGKTALALVVIQLGYGAVLFLRQPETPSFKRYSVDAAGKFSFSPRRNVILLILDSFQTDVFDEIVRETPEIAAGFDGFTYFRNALGGYPFTELSVALMLTGRYYDNSRPFEEWKKDAFETGSLPAVLKTKGWEVDLYPKVSYSLYYSEDIASNIVRGMPRAERMLDVAYIFDLGLFRSLPHFLKRPVYNDQDWFVRRIYLSTRKSVSKGLDAAPRIVGLAARRALWNRDLFSRKAFQKSQDIRFVDAMLHDSGLGGDRDVFKFYHIGGPHIPLELDENLN